MTRYILRSVKYFVTFTVLVLGLMWVQAKYGQSPLPFEELLSAYFHQWNGWALLGSAIVLAATYPLFGFTSRRIAGNVATHRQQIMTAMEVMGMSLVGGQEGVMTFRAGAVQRLTTLFEDEIRVEQCGDEIVISGLRRLAVRIAFRMEGYITNFERTNED